jgi:PTS system cellobiose-specific IIC component
MKMKKIVDFLEEKMAPIAGKIAENKYLSALQKGLMLSMPVLIIGSMAIIIADFPLPAYQNFISEKFGDMSWMWCWDMVFPATIGLISILSTIGIAHTLAHENGVEEMPAVALALVAYFLLIPLTDGMYSSDDFGAMGLFIAMLSALACTQLYSMLIKKGIKLKMPSSFPSFVAKQFEAIIPGTIIILIWLIIRIIFATTSYGTITNFIIVTVQTPLINISTTLGGTLIASFSNSFLWSFGIHGTNVLDAFMQPLWYAARFANLDAYKAGSGLPYIVTQDFINMIVYLGGSGITFPLSLLMLFKAKSKRVKAIGKVSILPGLFNVNEPVIFGLPIVLNPIMLIPFFLSPVSATLISFLSMKYGIVPKPNGITVPWTMPAPIGGWMMTGSWRGAALQIVVLIVSGLIYYPFIKVLDHKYLLEESKSEINN